MLFRSDRIRSTCKECNGSQICEHDRIRSICKDCNFEGYLYNNVSTRGRIAVKKFNEKASAKDYLGIDIKFYKEYLESKFTISMTWENYGTDWEIDHILPLSGKDMDFSELIKRLHYTNTQPLNKIENRIKHNRE